MLHINEYIGMQTGFKINICSVCSVIPILTCYSDGKSKPWCQTCNKEPHCLKTGLNCHLKSKSYKKSQASTSFTGNVDDIWKRVVSNNNDRAKSMEIKICAFLAEHNSISLLCYVTRKSHEIA